MGARLYEQEVTVSKHKFVGFLQADLDQNLPERRSSDSLPFYQVFARKIERKIEKNARIKFDKLSQHRAPTANIIFAVRVDVG